MRNEEFGIAFVIASGTKQSQRLKEEIAMSLRFPQ